MAPAVAGDFILSGDTLTFAAGATESAGEVTITAVDNQRREADKRVTVSGTASLASVNGPTDVTLTIAAAAAQPKVTLVLDPPSITEAGGVSTVTGELNTALLEPFTVTVSLAPEVAADFILSGDTLTFAVGATESTGEVTITALDNDEVSSAKMVMVTGTVSGADVPAPEEAILTVTDDDTSGPQLPEPEPVAVALRVADAAANEADRVLVFTVRLDRAAPAAVTVDYATQDGTARAGEDYRAAAGTLTIAAGETRAEVRIELVADAVPEADETFTLVLSGAQGGTLADERATGVIEDAVSVAAWLSRFGRTVGTHVRDVISDRFWGTPGQESYLTVGGYRLPLGDLAAVEPETGDSAPSRTLHSGETLTLRRILPGSAFRLSLGADQAEAGPQVTAWGRVAGTRFNGQDEPRPLGGDVLTGAVGVDGTWDRVSLGLAVAHSLGYGGYDVTSLTQRAAGDLQASLTSLHPYLWLALTDRLELWGLLGYGRGVLTLAPEDATALESDTALLMGAFGVRGTLLAAPDGGGFQLATRTDALFTRTTADGAPGLAPVLADVHRLRLILEGSRVWTGAEGRTVTPAVEVGLRHDWGDAETGFGFELGGRMRYADPGLGLTAEGAVRGLLAHEDQDYQEWAASGSLRFGPGAGGQGLSLTLAPTWGSASWRQTTAGPAQSTQPAPGGRLNAEVAYGLPAPMGSGLLTPYVGAVFADGADQTFQVGARLQPNGQGGLTLSLQLTRHQPAVPQPPHHGLRLQAAWGF